MGPLAVSYLIRALKKCALGFDNVFQGDMSERTTATANYTRQEANRVLLYIQTPLYTNAPGMYQLHM